jgi:hypothetical protein
MARLLLVAALLVFLAAPASAQDPRATAALRVRVYDSGSGLPIPGARVGLTDVGLFALTDTAGVGTLTGIPPGLHVLEIAMFGYAPEGATLDFGPGSLAAGDVALTFQPIPLEEIMVQGRSRWSARLQGSGFYERAGKGIGVQLDRLAIRDYNVFLLSEVLLRLPIRPGFAGFVDPDPTQQDVDYTDQLPQDCAPGIYVDGTPWIGFLDDLPLFWVEGLEFYTSPTQVPIQYQGGGAFCGLVLIWTG